MGTFYAGERTFYTEETNGIERMYESPNKLIEYDHLTLEPIVKYVPRGTIEVRESPVVEENFPVPGIVVKKEINPLECAECHFVAKSNAGLAVHKKKHTR